MLTMLDERCDVFCVEVSNVGNSSDAVFLFLFFYYYYYLLCCIYEDFALDECV